MRSREAATTARTPLAPLLAKEISEILGGRALWTMLLLACPLIGYSFFQAVSLYGEASEAALQSPVLATSLSPLDGVLVPTFGAAYVAVTLLFPFVAIRALGHEKESGALRLLVQLPYRAATLIGAKLVAVLAAWALATMPVVSALVVWRILGGHLAAAETANLLLGHALYGMLVGAIALFSASVAESAATAAIITDQGAGILFNLKPNGDYLTVRANCLENNLRRRRESAEPDRGEAGRARLCQCSRLRDQRIEARATHRDELDDPPRIDMDTFMAAIRWANADRLFGQTRA